MKTVYFFGAGARAHVAVDLLAWQFKDRLAVGGYFDDRKPAGSEGPWGYPVLAGVEEGLERLDLGRDLVFLALGTYASARSCEILLTLREMGAEFAQLISPKAHISPSARIGENALIMPGVFIGAGVVAGDLLTAHGGAVVEHDCTIGHNVMLGPGVTLSGFATLESHVFMGVGSRVLPEVSVCSGSLIGGGAVVLEEIPSGVIALGIPARNVRPTRPEDEVPSKQEILKLRAMGMGAVPGA